MWFAALNGREIASTLCRYVAARCCVPAEGAASANVLGLQRGKAGVQTLPSGQACRFSCSRTAYSQSSTPCMLSSAIKVLFLPYERCDIRVQALLALWLDPESTL